MEEDRLRILQRKRRPSRRAASLERRFFETVFVALLQEMAAEGEVISARPEVRRRTFGTTETAAPADREWRHPL